MNKDTSSKPQYMPVVKVKTVYFYENAVKSVAPTSRLVDVSKLQGIIGHKRRAGDICGFSLASRSRLRNFLASCCVPNSVLYGLTLTLPNLKHIKISDTIQDEEKTAFTRGQSFSGIVNRFCLYFKRRFPNSALVWRAELQKRGAPHLHCAVYLSRFDHEKIEADTTQYRRQPSRVVCRVFNLPLAAEFVSLWTKAVQPVWISTGEEFSEWFGHLLVGMGLCLDALPDAPRLIRYMCDHLSKHKKEQLGYRGRQWGKCGKFSFQTPEVLRGDDVVTSYAQDYTQQAIGMIRRHTVYKDCIFGYCRSRYHKATSGVSYAGSETIGRIKKWALQRAFDERETNALKMERRIAKSFECGEPSK